MKKVLKFLLKAFLWLLAIVVVLLLAIPLWISPVGKPVANSTVPGVVGTDFHLGQLQLNPYSGHFEIGDLQLSNPKGYPEQYAVTLGGLTVDMDTLSLCSDVIHIKNIEIKDVFVSYVSGGENDVNNFLQIQYNVAGGKDKYEAAEKEKKAEEELKKDKSAEEKSGKKVVIDRLMISGVSIKLGLVPIKIPVDITLTDIGRKTGGATLAEAWDQIFAAVCNAAGALGDQLRAVGDLAGEAAKQAAAAAEKATKAVGDAAGQATKAVGDAAGQATKAVGDVAGQATSAVTDTAAKATEGATKAVGDAAKKATEGATKALDSLKNLW